MKFFLDTANIEEIKRCASFGFLDGVTTNPSLMARENISDQAARIEEICSLTEGPVSAEVIAADTEGMVEEARALADIAPNVAVKIPLTMPGLSATRSLADQGLAVNLTLVFSPLQALLAAKAGAAFVSPFVGRLDDVGMDGMDLVEDIVSIFSNYAFETEVIVASIRSPQHVLRAALIGADICTVPFKVIEQLASHPLTDKGLAAFLADHEKVAAKRPHPNSH
ncbi:MAG: fructose-6-phosphate aldolase [Deltaproteobacteria bacterium]|jgi:transaldolase|nr:fructose-6-phosphate aldolase [Deltaproteobacteria bacterium]